MPRHCLPGCQSNQPFTAPFCAGVWTSHLNVALAQRRLSLSLWTSSGIWQNQEAAAEVSCKLCAGRRGRRCSAGDRPGGAPQQGLQLQEERLPEEVLRVLPGLHLLLRQLQVH